MPTSMALWHGSARTRAPKVYNAALNALSLLSFPHSSPTLNTLFSLFIAQKMSSVPRALKHLISTFIPAFHDIAAHPEECNQHRGLCHVTVVSLGQADFGYLYRVVSSSLHSPNQS